MMKTFMKLMLAASVAASFAASAGIPNPDNDSGTFFACKGAGTVPAVSVARVGHPTLGTISPDGLYVWKNPDRGWVAREHSYVYAAGKFEHAADCPVYNTAKAKAPGYTPVKGAGS